MNESLPLLRAPRRERAFSERRLAAIAICVMLSPLAMRGRLDRSQEPAPKAFQALGAPIVAVRRPAAPKDSLPELNWTQTQDAPSAVATQSPASPSAPSLSRPATIPVHPAQTQAKPVLADAWWNLGKSVLGGSANSFHLVNNFIPAPRFGQQGSARGVSDGYSSRPAAVSQTAGSTKILVPTRFGVDSRTADGRRGSIAAAFSGQKVSSKPTGPSGDVAPSYSNDASHASTDAPANAVLGAQDAAAPSGGGQSASSGAAASGAEQTAGSSSNGSISGASSSCTGSGTEGSGSADGAQIITQPSLPSSASAGQSYSVSVAVRNSGSSTWTDGSGFELGATDSTWGTCRISLDAGDSIAPGDEKTFSFVVTAPSSSGTYTMQWRMIDGDQWFGDSSASVSLVVQ